MSVLPLGHIKCVSAGPREIDRIEGKCSDDAIIYVQG